MNEMAWNSTISSTTMDSSGLASLITILVVFGAAIIVGGFALSNLERYKRIWAILAAMGKSALYFAYGLCVVVPVVCLYFLISWLIDFTEGFHIDPIWIVYLIGGYAGISVVGWLAKKGADRATAMHEKMKEGEKE